MVSAGAANRLAFGIDRGGMPWSDIPQAKCLILAGINVGECFPILTDYIWRARDNGAKIIVIDPRMTPIARTADLLLPVRPGRDSALLNGLLHVCIARGWIDTAFIAQHTTGFEMVRAAVADYTPEHVEAITGVPAAAIEQAAAWWGLAHTVILLHARGIEHHTKGTENCLACINSGIGHGQDRQARLWLLNHYWTGQWPGGANTGSAATSCRVGVTLTIPSIAALLRNTGGYLQTTCRAWATPPQRCARPLNVGRFAAC